mmetsp:Transcript_92781/g.193926  ORF Transcript_92781/g.193926 Transcript_92781/m.193926 type:complete len:219 (-) Transcript_92781:235-891(-)
MRQSQKPWQPISARRVIPRKNPYPMKLSTRARNARLRRNRAPTKKYHWRRKAKQSKFKGPTSSSSSSSSRCQPQRKTFSNQTSFKAELQRKKLQRKLQPQEHHPQSRASSEKSRKNACRKRPNQHPMLLLTRPHHRQRCTSPAEDPPAQRRMQPGLHRRQQPPPRRPPPALPRPGPRCRMPTSRCARRWPEGWRIKKPCSDLLLAFWTKTKRGKLPRT